MIHKNKIHEGRHLKKYLSNVPWYLISSTLTKLMGFILLPIYTRYFTQEEVGSLSIYESMGRIIIVVLSLYIDAAFARFYYKIKAESPDILPSFFSTHFWFVFGWGGVVSALIVLTIKDVVPGLPPSSILVVPALVISQLFAQLVVMLTSIWAANLYVKRLAIFNVSFSFLSVIFTIYLVVFDEKGWDSRIYSLFVVSVLQLITVLLIVIKKDWLCFRFDFNIIKRSLKYSIPLVPNVVAGWIAMFSDRLILSYYGELDQVGVYSIAAQVALILYIINDSITKIQGPLAMSGMTDNIKKAKAKMAEFLYLYFSIMVVLYIFISLIVPIVIDIAFGVEYRSVKPIFILLGWVYIFSGIYRVFTNVISFHGATWIISSGAILQVLLNISCNLLLIPLYGMYAAAVSTVISMASYTLWLAYWSQKIDKIYLDIKKFMLIALVGWGGGLSLILLDEEKFGWLTIFSVKVMLLAFVIYTLFLLQNTRSKLYVFKLLKVR